jgi:hypothetical protein
MSAAFELCLFIFRRSTSNLKLDGRMNHILALIFELAVVKAVIVSEDFNYHLSSID